MSATTHTTLPAYRPRTLENGGDGTGIPVDGVDATRNGPEQQRVGPEGDVHIQLREVCGVAPSGGSSFRIGVVGDSPVSDALRKVAEQKRALGKPIEVVTLAPGQWTDVHVLFIVGNTAVEDAIAHYNNRAALIITESNRRMPKGSMINLINRDNKIRFELNLIEAKESNLRIASQLANLAEKVIQ